jgi:23S rRNA pseudouridine1911/1915/1917 synthase
MPVPDPADAQHRIEAPTSAQGLRTDVFLARVLPTLSRARIQHLLKAGLITTGGRPVKGSAIVTAGTVFDVVIPPPATAALVPEDLPLPILYEDADIVVINKPAEMVVHPGAGHTSGTVVNALLAHVSDLSGIGGTERPGIVHRLDRGTSGVMVVAKHDRAHRDLSQQFQNRTVRKEYLALVWGHPPSGLTFDAPIGRHRVHRHKMSGRPARGRTALTSIVDVERLGETSLLRVVIGTGRTHQIRVHLSEAGFPIVGDELYGGGRKRSGSGRVFASLNRPFLHAARLTIAHPREHQEMTFEAPLDATASQVIEMLRQRSQRPDAL